MKRWPNRGLPAATVETQRDFVADAAHALRSPLTALKLQVQLAERASDPAARAAAFAKVHERLDRASHLVHQLLTLAHHECVSTACDATVDLAGLAERVVIEYTPLAASRGIDLGLVHEQSACQVQGDADQLGILLSNLVDNALRHTPSGGQVDIRLHCDAQGSLLQVCDSGPGVPADERERVFDRFYRGSGAAGIGSGLGLAIVRVIADSHGARVSLLESSTGGLRVDVRFGAP